MIGNSPKLERGAYDYLRPVDVGSLTGEILFQELINTRAFKRMRSIRFLGGIDYLLVPTPNGARGNLRHTRFQHSLGVARLAMLFARQRDLPSADRRIL